MKGGQVNSFSRMGMENVRDHVYFAEMFVFCLNFNSVWIILVVSVT